MSQLAEITETLQTHRSLCERLLRVLEREHQSLRGTESDPTGEAYEQRKGLISDLDRSVATLRRCREYWQRLTPSQRQECPEIATLLRSNQDLTMKVIVLDRENEQSLLRHGLVPVNELPPPRPQRPHFVAEMYRRNGAA